MKHAYLYFALAFAPWAAADGPRDPTRPPQPKTQLAVVHESAPVLSAIISSNSRRVAIFNGQVVRSGDSVGAGHGSGVARRSGAFATYQAAAACRSGGSCG